MSQGKLKVMAGSSPALLHAFCVAFMLVLASAAQAESGASAAPVEVRALNAIFHKWSISATPNQWNISGEPCSGAAINSTSLDDVHFNPLIKCDCSYDNNTTCHITQLKVYALDVVGVIPVELWTLTFLTNLDLSFNNITGQIPDSLFNLSLLACLCLGDNKLSGTHPAQKVENLLNIDLSYNNLGGSFPSWVRQQNFQLIIDGNNFTITSSNSGTLPSEWNCLQRDFPCNRGPNIVLKKFDLQKEAGGVSFQAIQKEFLDHVSENYLEVRFWAGKGTCCTPRRGTYGPFISAISFNPDFKPTTDSNPPSSKGNRTGQIPAGVVSVVGAGVLGFLSCRCCLRRRKPKQDDDDVEMLGAPNLRHFSYTELRTATEDFAEKNKLGKGGFGTVYRGILREQTVAVKRLAAEPRRGEKQFETEINTISSVQHRNLVTLYGYCNEGDKRLLVYEFLENGSLHDALFENGSLNLNWPRRHKICLGVARGLAYLHDGSRRRIIHRDVKPGNILLDKDCIPKISDFGLAKPYDEENTHINTNPAGTCGYWAPEYCLHGQLSDKADVYSFGVVALETVSGRRNYDPNLEEDKQQLLGWAWDLHEKNSALELVDPTLSELNEEEVKRVIGVSLLCTLNAKARPSMSEVEAMLAGHKTVRTPTSRPGYLCDGYNDDVHRGVVAALESSGRKCDSAAITSLQKGR